MTIYDSANKLALEIKNSEEYQQFLEAKNKIKADQANYRMVQNFQLKQLEIQQAQFMNEEVTLESQQELERLYSLLSLNPNTRQYLEAEFRISKVMNDVQVIIGEVMEDVLPIGFEDME